MYKRGDLRISPKTGKQQWYDGNGWCTIGTKNAALPVRYRDPEAVERNRAARLRWQRENKIQQNLRKRLYKVLKGKCKVGSAVRDLGCSVDELRVWLESKFYGGMTWENYGSEWHIDHVRPLASFDLTDRAQFLEAAHYTNLQPLTVCDHKEKTALDYFKLKQTA